MTKAAIYWHPDAYETTGKALMGRQSAGEGFMRGYIRHGSAERLALWNGLGKPVKELEPLLKRIEPTAKPVDWIPRNAYGEIGKIGVAYLPVPGLAQYAWGRRSMGDHRAFSLCGVTHTTATARVLAGLNDLALAPVQPWDALVCTSRAVVASLQVQSEMLDDYLKHRLGAQTIPRPQYAHIPLGVNTADFTPKPEDRARWRKDLGIEEDEIVVLYVGRFSVTSKMNPVPMALALEKAAVRSGKQIHWVMAGWADEKQLDHYKKWILDHCLNVSVHFVDGRVPETRFSIWAVGDIFLSLSDNIQETFGLTPVEAMAAGLPSIISDWDGYKDLLRHQTDGFRISSYTPAAGLARDLAFMHSQEWSSYDNYIGSVAQFAAVDIEETVQALCELMANPDLRARMGAAAQARARQMFDWKVIIPRYEALWAELNARRRAAPAEPAPARNGDGNPWMPDPLRMFASYPTEWLTATTMLAPANGMDWAEAQILMKTHVVRMATNLLPTSEDVEKIMAILVERRQITAGDLLARLEADRRPRLERGLVWMAKYGLLQILPRSNVISA
jgi:glycosyltransferase involved in cell wall biosynthesis